VTPPERPTAGSDDPAGGSDLVETQIERTEMAWARTALACAALAAFSTHLTGVEARLPAAVAIAALVGLPGLVASWWRIRGLRAAPRPEAPRTVGVALLAGAVVVSDLVALALLVR